MQKFALCLEVPFELGTEGSRLLETTIVVQQDARPSTEERIVILLSVYAV